MVALALCEEITSSELSGQKLLKMVEKRQTKNNE